MDARVAVALLREPGDRVGVAVQDVARPVAVDPVAQAVEADVRRVVGVVVDAARRAVADQHVGGRQPPREPRRLALRVVVRAAAAVADAALEAGERERRRARCAACAGPRPRPRAAGRGASWLPCTPTFGSCTRAQRLDPRAGRGRRGRRPPARASAAPSAPGPSAAACRRERARARSAILPA